MALAGGPTVTLTFKGDVDDLRRAISSIGIMVGGLGASVGILGAIGAAASAAVLAVAAVPLAFAGIGIAAAAQQQIVKDRFTELKNHVMGEMASMTASIQGELLITADHLQAWFDRLAPTFENLFKLSSPYITQMTDALLNLVERALPGLQTALGNAQPIMDVFARGLGMLGEGLGGFFAKLSEGTPGAVQGLDALFTLTKDLLIYLGQLVGQLANALGPAFAALEPSVMRIVTALGDGLLRIVQSLAPYVGTLGSSIADLLTAALDALLPVVEAVVPLLAQFGGVLIDSVTPIVRELGPVLREVVTALVEGLQPVIPVVAQAFRDMTPVMLQIAREAGPLLAEIIRTLAPLFLALVQAALDLTQSLLPVIPPLLEMANNAMPLLKGVIQDVLIPVIKWLVEEFKGLIDYGTKVAENFADLSKRWRTYWEEIKAAFADANDKIRAGIEAFASLPETARKHWDAMYQAIKDRIGAIVTEAQAFPGKVTGAIGDMTTALVDKGRAFINGFWDGAKAIIESVLDWFRRLPTMILDAIGDTSKTLYHSGQSMIDGFNQGIESKREAAKAAGIDAVGATESVFPQSPPPEGPFAGLGWTFYRGQSLIDGFIEGIRAAAPKLYNAVTSVLSQVQSGMGDLSGGVQELLNHLAEGGQVFEDLSFKGMSDSLAKVNDQLADMFYAAFPGQQANVKTLSDWAKKQFGLIQTEDLSWVKPSFYGGGGAAPTGGSPIQLQVAPGADSALASMLMNLVRTGQLQLQRA
jgi:phage-related protein